MPNGILYGKKEKKGGMKGDTMMQANTNNKKTYLMWSRLCLSLGSRKRGKGMGWRDGREEEGRDRAIT